MITHNQLQKYDRNLFYTKSQLHSNIKGILWKLNLTPGNSDKIIRNIPFLGNDISVGSELEIQSAVRGEQHNVDLPSMIVRSDYFQNLIRRVETYGLSFSLTRELERFIEHNPSLVWENSWVTLQFDSLTDYARHIFNEDLIANKSDPFSPLRKDADKFIKHINGKKHIRIPVSYLLKIALAEVVGRYHYVSYFRVIAERLFEHLISDNSSTETTSFYVVRKEDNLHIGESTAREAAMRYLFLQVLIRYANKHMGLLDSGQEAILYFSPNAARRQRQLSECLPDSLYRELFMNPCLSGWQKGEEKSQYMSLCHQVLTRAQLNSILKLKECGILSSARPIALPFLSNVSLANNGVHISLGSRKLTLYRKGAGQNFSLEDEKYIGDLICKIVEIFIPLFVGTLSAAPYRIDFADFHPERLLLFLPHELDYTHLRMFWKTWQKKASLKIYGIGNMVLPTGFKKIDVKLGKMLGLRGDILPDFRLLDYPVAWLSTINNRAFDGSMYNQERLKKEMEQAGIFNTAMSFYCLYRLRSFTTHGFCGFEGRYYSLFPDFSNYFADAVLLQQLVTAIAFRYIARCSITHNHLPDDPMWESERRQIFFATAAGLPHFFIHKYSKNYMINKVLEFTKQTKHSKHYPDYWKVETKDYLLALLTLIRVDCWDIVEATSSLSLINKLERIIKDEEPSAYQNIITSLLNTKNVKDVIKIPAEDFNALQEEFYRTTMLEKHIKEAIGLTKQEFESSEKRHLFSDNEINILRKMFGQVDNLPNLFDELACKIFEYNNASKVEIEQFIILMMCLFETKRRI